MRKLWISLVACLFVSCFSGCGVKTVKLRTFGFPSVSEDSVVVHVNKPPDVPYDSYLSMQEETGDYADIVSGFRRRAAQMGMDAIIVHTQNNTLPKQDSESGGIWASVAGGNMNNLMATGIKYRKEEGVKK
jgi:hypothetical protein